MCQVDSKTEAQLEQTIKQFLDEGRMFTGYDVTLETRTRENVKMRHQDVRVAIHELQCLIDAIEWGHEDGQGNDVRWKKSQIAMPNGHWAFVYHPETLDPNQYQAQGQKNAVAQQTQQVVVAQTPAINANQSSTPTGSDSGGQNNDGTFCTDYRNRLFIRTEFVKALGLQRDDTVFVIADSDNNRVLLANSVGLQDLGNTLVNAPSVSQQIERNGDLRLSSKTLRTAGLDIAENFVIETCKMGTAPNEYSVVEIRQA